MGTNKPSERVIVGVAESLAGYRALRLAVAEARRRSAMLCAVRVWNLDESRNRTLTVEWSQCRAREALDTVYRVFRDTMGGLPADLDVEIKAIGGRPGEVLVDLGHLDSDLLLIGASQRRWYRRIFHRSVSRYCATHATCPVLLVPPDAFAREIAREGTAKVIRRDLSTLAA